MSTYGPAPGPLAIEYDRSMGSTATGSSTLRYCPARNVKGSRSPVSGSRRIRRIDGVTASIAATRR